LDKTSHVKVWISYAQFEGTEIGSGADGAREIFKKAYQQLKDENLSEERVMLLDAWRVFERNKGDAQHVSEVETMMPRRIKRKRMREDENGNDVGWEEYFDYRFPDDEGAASSNLKILEMAAKWKQQKAAVDDDSDVDSDDD
jgi:crooked neck